MALYARKLKRFASDWDGGGGFVALIMLSKKKGGRPIEFMLYRYMTGRNPEMIEATSIEEAHTWFPYGKAGFLGKEVDQGWVKTSRWLYDVAVEYGDTSPVWIKVGRPRPKRKKIKRRLIIGDINSILKETRESLKIARLNADIDSPDAEAEILSYLVNEEKAIINEMRFMRKQAQASA